MLFLKKPSLDDKEKYIDMISEWKKYDGPYVPCIVNYDCSRPLDDLDYDAVLEVVQNYSVGKVFDYDIDHFDSSNFYFIFNNQNLVGVGEVRHNLKPLGQQTIGHIMCGIRPSMRRKGYASQAVKLMIEKLKDENVNDIILCHCVDDIISSKFIKQLGFEFRNSISISDKVIMRYSMKI